MQTKLSKNEERLYRLITRSRAVQNGGKISTEKLAQQFYGDGMPIHGRIYIANLLRSIKRKTPMIDGLRQIASTEQTGRGGNEVWLEPLA